MKIGILTGGGDVPGLNACIKAVVNRAVSAGHTVMGIRRGWTGLLNINPDDEENSAQWLIPLDQQAVYNIDHSGGTLLRTSRLNPSKVTPNRIPPFLQSTSGSADPNKTFDFTAHILKNLEYLEIDVLILIGGDDVLNYGYRLHTEGVPLIAIPKTMDNDVFGTDYCIGFSTAITRSVNFINNLRTSISSHERIGVIELFGRLSGETSLIAAYLAGVDRAIISEVPFDPQQLAVYLMADKQKTPQNYAIMTISEGASMLGKQTPDNVTGIGAVTKETLKKITGENIIYQQMAYLMRSGTPDATDLMVSLNFANMAMDLISQTQYGYMMALKAGKYTNVPLQTIVQGVKRVDIDELYDVDAYRPKVRHVIHKPMFLY